MKLKAKPVLPILGCLLVVFLVLNDKEDAIQQSAFGAYGTYAGAFEYLQSIHITGDGRLAISDAIRQDVQLFTATGKYAGHIAFENDNLQPLALTSDEQGNLYISNSLDGTISQFSNNNRLMNTFGSFGSEPGDMIDVSGICYAPKSQLLFVADRGNQRIQAFKRNGKLVYSQENSAWDLLGIACGADADIFAVDGASDEILRFSPRAELIEVLKAPPERPWVGLSAITMDKAGNLLVLEKTGGRLWNLDAQGQVLDYVDGLQSDKRDKHWTSITTNDVGQIYVADRTHHQVIMFSWTRKK